MKRSGFTLIELLVVIAIISILATILLPSLSMAQEMTKSVKCMSNLRVLGQTTAMFQSDNEGSFPSNLYSDGVTHDGRKWQGLLANELGMEISVWGLVVDYIGTPFECPSSKGLMGNGWHGVDYKQAYCPSAGSWYGVAGPKCTRTMEDVTRQPSGVAWLVDGNEYTWDFYVYYGAFALGGVRLRDVAYRHLDKPNVLWLDWHVSNVEENELTFGDFVIR